MHIIPPKRAKIYKDVISIKSSGTKLITRIWGAYSITKKEKKKPKKRTNEIYTFLIRSKAPPVANVSFPKSSTVTAESFPSVKPAANGWPGLLQKTSHYA